MKLLLIALTLINVAHAKDTSDFNDYVANNLKQCGFSDGIEKDDITCINDNSDKCTKFGIETHTGLCLTPEEFEAFEEVGE